MKMTPRENVLSLFRRQGYEYAPSVMYLCPSQKLVFQQKTGLSFEKHFEDYFNIPLRHIENLKSAPTDRNTFAACYFPQGLLDGTYISEWGTAHEQGEGAGHFNHMRHPLSGDISMDDLESYPFPVFLPDTEGKLKTQTEAIQGAGLTACVGMNCTVWETAWYIRSMEDLMADMMAEDEKATFLLDFITGTACQKARAYAAAGVDIIKLGDDVGMQSTTMMSADMYRTWLKPRLKKVIDAAREIKPDILIFYHSCGYVQPYIEDFIEIGIDILNPVQPESMPFAGIHEKYGDRLSFKGALGTQTTMPFGTPDDVRREVFEYLDIAGEHGGLLCAPSHVIEPEVPWENIIAYAGACENYKVRG